MDKKILVLDERRQPLGRLRYPEIPHRKNAFLPYLFLNIDEEWLSLRVEHIAGPSRRKQTVLFCSGDKIWLLMKHRRFTRL